MAQKAALDKPLPPGKRLVLPGIGVYVGALDELMEVPHGSGLLYELGGSMYEGEWRNGTKDGRGNIMCGYR